MKERRKLIVMKLNRKLLKFAVQSGIRVALYKVAFKARSLATRNSPTTANDLAQLKRKLFVFIVRTGKFSVDG